MADKHRLDYLKEATAEELIKEKERRRKEALAACSDEEIEEQLKKQPGYDGPRYVEK